MTASSHVLALSCTDRPGLVAAVSGALSKHGGNITDAQQYNDPATERFFMRLVFDMKNAGAFQDTFADLAGKHSMDWRMRARDRKMRVVIAVSRFDHCLVDLIYRTRKGALPIDIVGIVSNHPRESVSAIDLSDLPFHHLPITHTSKPQQEAAFRGVVEETEAELVVLARYMQILSDKFSRLLSGRCINIHHSFLPGFKGARPYHQAHRRGVKMIGATAHFVTPDLDEGPIIAQGVEPIRHSDSAEALVAKGREIEQRVLARAVHAFAEDRVFLNGQRTVVFD